jgi:PAS domain S-box-containing protein
MMSLQGSSLGSIYQQVFRRSATATALLDDAGMIRDCNPAFIRLFPAFPQSLVSQSFSSLLPAEDQAIFERALAERQDQSLDLRVSGLPISADMAFDPDANLTLIFLHPRAFSIDEQMAQVLQALFMNSDDVIVITDDDARYIAVNDAACQTLEIPRERLLTMNVAEVMGMRRDEPRFARIWSRFLERGAERAELTYRRPVSGDEITLELTSKAHFYPHRHLSVMRDITARKRIEAELARSEERYRMMFLANPHPMWVFDVETLEFLDVNDAAVQHYGYSREEFLSMKILDIRLEEDREIVRKIIQNQSDEFALRGIWRHIRKDGSLITVLGASHALHYEGRRARLALLIDITEQRRLEIERQRLVEQLQKLAKVSIQVNIDQPIETTLQMLTEAARDLIGAHQAVCSLTTNQRWSQAITAVSMSEKYARWAEYDADPDGTGIYRLVCETNRPMRLTQAELEAHPAWRGFGEHAQNHPPMRGWLAVPLVNRRGENIGVMQLSDRYEGDFTADDENVLIQLAQLASASVDNARLFAETQKYAEDLEARVQERTRELTAANLRLMELDRLKSKFISDVSHELRNPIAQLSLKIELIKRGGPQSLERHMPELEQKMNDLLTLTSQVLDISRLEVARERTTLDEVDLNSVVREVVHSYSADAVNQGLSLNVALDPGLPMIWAARPQVIQVITNLVNNAIKYTPKGFVRVFTQYDRDRGMAVLIVQDSGIGVDPDDLEHLFDRFHRGRQALERGIPGTGLGLPIVQEIAQIHGGHVEVESTVGVGTTFRVYFRTAGQQPFSEAT